MLESFNQYFNKTLDDNSLKVIEHELDEKDLIKNGQITSKEMNC